MQLAMKYQKKDIYISTRKTKNHWWIKNNNNIVLEYQKIANLLDDALNQLSKLQTKNWVEINDESREHTILIVKSNLKLLC